MSVLFSAVALGGAPAMGGRLHRRARRLIGWNVYTARKQYEMAHAARENLEVAVSRR